MCALYENHNHSSSHNNWNWTYQQRLGSVEFYSWVIIRMVRIDFVWLSHILWGLAVWSVSSTATLNYVCRSLSNIRLTQWTLFQGSTSGKNVRFQNKFKLTWYSLQLLSIISDNLRRVTKPLQENMCLSLTQLPPSAWPASIGAPSEPRSHWQIEQIRPKLRQHFFRFPFVKF